MTYVHKFILYIYIYILSVAHCSILSYKTTSFQTYNNNNNNCNN